jgi:hypothetical protein
MKRMAENRGLRHYDIGFPLGGGVPVLAKIGTVLSTGTGSTVPVLKNVKKCQAFYKMLWFSTASFSQNTIRSCFEVRVKEYRRTKARLVEDRCIPLALE